MKRKLVGAAMSFLVLGCDVPPTETAKQPPMSPEVEARVQKLESALSKAPELVAQIRLSPEHALEILELPNGGVGYSELGTYFQKPMTRTELSDTELLDPVKVFKRLSPTQQVPAKLLALAAKRGARSVPSPQALSAAPSGTLYTSDGPVQYQSSSSDISTQSRALTNEDTDGGSTPGTCPFNIFKDVTGPLGRFCGTDGDYQWCKADITSGWYIDALHNRTKFSHATVCTDQGTSHFIVRLGVREGVIKETHDFFQPAGTWRQWRSDADCEWHFPIGTCDNHSIKYEVLADGGRVQFGGQWKAW